ncbi:unknown [Clostridium sp. CAG:590]|nr:unknown [Clostridium sp. CAG:590]
MKKFGQAVKTVAAAMVFCFVGMLSISANAAYYQKGVTYVDPQTNSKGQYYSVLKQRMATYSDMTLHVVYPKGEALSVSTSKKALSAAIVSQDLENPGSDSVKMYVAGPNVPGYNVKETGAYYVPKNAGNYDDDDDFWLMKKDETGNYYIEKFFTGSPYKKIYRTPTYVTQEIEDAYTVEETYTKYDGTTGTRTKTYNLYNDGRGKGWYYEKNWAAGQNNYQKVDASDYEYSKADIQLDSTKKGNYSVKIKVGSKTTTVKVYVTDNTTPVSQMKLGKSVLQKVSRKASSKSITEAEQSNFYVSSKVKSGKLKLSATKGYKITGMVVAYVNKDGKAVYKKVKNGKKITLSQALAYRSTSTRGYYNKDSKKRTQIFVSYKDSYTGYSVTYAPVKKGGLSKIKRTIKFTGDSTKYVDYLTYGSDDSTNIYAY